MNEEIYDFILGKFVNYNDNQQKFTKEDEISDFLDTIINDHKELLDSIFNNNNEIKEEDNVTWKMDGIIMKVIMGTYGTFVYTQTLNKLCHHFNVTYD